MKVPKRATLAMWKKRRWQVAIIFIFYTWKFLEFWGLKCTKEDTWSSLTMLEISRKKKKSLEKKRRRRGMCPSHAWRSYIYIYDILVIFLHINSRSLKRKKSESQQTWPIRPYMVGEKYWGKLFNNYFPTNWRVPSKLECSLEQEQHIFMQVEIFSQVKNWRKR